MLNKYKEILFIFPYALRKGSINAGGAQATISLAEKFSSNGCNVKILYHKGELDSYKYNGIEYIPWNRITTIQGLYMDNLCPDLILIVLFGNVIDLISNSTNMSEYYSKVPIAAIYHNAEIDCKDYKMWRWINYKIDKFFVVCEYAKKNAISCGINFRKVAVIRNMIRSDIKFIEKEAIYNNERIEGSILFVGAYIRHKGLHLLLKAFNTKLLNNTRLFLIGSAKLWNSHEEVDLGILNHHDNIKNLGEMDSERLSEIYRKSQFIILPSKMESAGLVLLEAMAMGCVPIISNRGGMPEFVRDKYNGLILGKLSAKEIRKTIINITKKYKLNSSGYKILQKNGFDTASNYKRNDSSQVVVEELKNVDRGIDTIYFVLLVSNDAKKAIDLISSIKGKNALKCEIIIDFGSKVVSYDNFSKYTNNLSGKMSNTKKLIRRISSTRNDIISNIDDGIIFFINTELGTISLEWIENAIRYLKNNEIDIAIMRTEKLCISWATSILMLRHLGGFENRTGIRRLGGYTMFYDDLELLNFAHNRGVLMGYGIDCKQQGTITNIIKSIVLEKGYDNLLKGILTGRLSPEYGERNILVRTRSLLQSLSLISVTHCTRKRATNNILYELGEFMMAIIKLYKPVVRK